MQFRLCTLLIVLALGPPVLAGAWWAYNRYRPRSNEERMLEILREFERMDAAGEIPFPEEPLIGYPFGPNDPRYPNGFPDQPRNKLRSD
jgi:hypothetical protein